MDKQSHHATYSCPHCEQTFKRPDHLNRHLVSHSDVRPFGCSFCELRFGRRDALLRHWRTCQHRAQAEDASKEPQRQKRGRKRLSCDPCVKAKRKCTRSYPCDACERLSLTCNLSKNNSGSSEDAACKVEIQDVDISSTVVSIPFEADGCDDTTLSYNALVPQQDVNMLYNPPYTMGCELMSPAVQSPELTHAFLPIPESTIYPSPANSLPSLQLLFLEHFTQTSGFASSFDCGNPIQRAQILRKLTAIPIRPPAIPYSDGNTTDLLEQDVVCHAPSNGIACYDSVDAVEPHRPGSMSCCWSCHPLFQKSEQIVQGIRKVVSKRSKIEWTPEMEQECRHFFAPPQVEKFLVAFFALWYPNVPTFHKPGFVAAQKPATLVAALSLIGASLTSDDAERQGSWRWITDVEEFVFQDDAFCDLRPGPCSMDESWIFRLEPRLDALRAAYSIVLFLQWEGNEEQRHRARHVRFPQAIAVARSILTLGPIRHNDLSQYLEPFHNFLNWKRFILKEEYIRTVLYVFLLDCAFKMFNNCSPRMTVDELNVGLTCPEVCFQASRIDEWKQYMDVWAASKTGKDRPIFRDVVSFICKEELSIDEWNILCEMSSLNFFSLANVFQNLIYQYHQPASRAFLESTVSGGSGPTPILNALANWKRTWLCRQTVLGDFDVYQVGAGNAWRRVGFFRHCFEFWRFALMVYRQLESTGWLERFDSFMDKDDMSEVHDLITRFQNVNIGEFDL